MSLTPAEKQKCYRERRRLNAEKEEENRRKDSENEAKCRQNKARKIVATATPCATPDVNLQSSSKKAGRKRVLLNRSKVVRENIQLRNEIKELKFKTDMYRKRWSRAKLKAEENVTSNSPRSRAKCTLNECFKVQLTPSKAKVVRQLTLFNTFSSCLKERYTKSTKKEKIYMHKLMLNSCLKKYRLLRIGQNSYFGCRIYQKPKSNKESIKVKRQLVTKFFLQDDVSRATSGKKETITLNKIKMQKRYILDNLRNLQKNL
ncbi:hypothetical protein AVEN_51268-1 [Araneus ventricosus]|uniref:Uncharacterized protein n=1 Tax=Araneus ventricosus TaxID=182803 RepID=A0A4Y2X143_ARAVE|nr:hypothetical protein AVEN_51268-1 [Araneus ventricosus]